MRTPPARDASVVICSRDRPQLLLDTVRSVLEGDAVPAEVVVVDQSDSPVVELASMRAVRNCVVRYLHCRESGLSRARNIGLRAAACDIAILIDDDMLVEASWLAALLDGLPEGSHCVATGRVLPAAEEGRGGSIPPAALVTRDTPAIYRGPQPMDVVPGANVALRREFVLALGGYDERLGAGTRFGSADDNDIGHRLLLAGAEVHHVPGAVVLHRAWRPRGELVGLRWRYGRGKGAFYAKHAGLRDRRLLQRAANDVAGRLRRAARVALRNPRSAAGDLLTVAGIASGALDWLLRERLAGTLRRR
ncbi:MAG TPA: glycosyltransferase [Solirubrobacteraceae bacterium]|nr:glycosyltransferase [Solirubrobacteraceae bacterium]